ncbi:MAG: hypothetical protein KatS3mg090_0816 [Patescibacteria group bacterium]|nr:MAG: hypothetical protein KatS3mg090_0816 [Patescibacteria group bacterium]
MLKFKGLSEFKEFIKGRKVVIMGLGLQGGGVDSAIFFARLNANVVVTDLKSSHELKNSIKQLGDFENITFVLGQHRKQDFETADLVVKNHKIKWSNKFLKLAESRKAIIINGIDLFFTLVNTENIIGVTGTRGKTTVTTMVYNFLKTKKNTYLLGNLPNSKNLQTLFELKQSDWVVMELSSWMLSGLHRVKKSPKFAVFTSFYPDHLDYYSSMDEYFYDKSAIFSYQKPEDFFNCK